MAEKNSDLIGRILNSIFYKSSFSKATRVSENAKGLLAILKNALQKTKDLGTGSVFDLIRSKVVLVGNLVKAYAQGTYRDIEVKNLIIIVAGLIYFISPIDLIPDFLPLLGYTDDVALLTFIVGSLSDELEKFELWEMNNTEN